MRIQSGAGLTDAPKLDAQGFFGQRFEIRGIACEHDSRGFGRADDDCVDRRARAGSMAKSSAPARQGGRQFGRDVAGLQEPVDRDLALLPASQAFDENRGGNYWRPKALGAELREERCRPSRAFGKVAHRARVQDQLHPVARLSPSRMPRTTSRA